MSERSEAVLGTGGVQLTGTEERASKRIMKNKVCPVCDDEGFARCMCQSERVPVRVATDCSPDAEGDVDMLLNAARSPDRRLDRIKERLNSAIKANKLGKNYPTATPFEAGVICGIEEGLLTALVIIDTEEDPTAEAKERSD